MMIKKKSLEKSHYSHTSSDIYTWLIDCLPLFSFNGLKFADKQTIAHCIAMSFGVLMETSRLTRFFFLRTTLRSLCRDIAPSNLLRVRWARVSLNCSQASDS